MDVGLLEIPAELAALLRVADGHQHGQANKIVEVSPPQVKAEYNLSLPADINSFPFSNFVNLHFQEPRLQPLEKTLQHPLTHLEGEEKLAALEIFKLVMRFMADVDLQGRKETTLGNYIAKKGLSNPKLRNEIFCQLANQLWQSSDSERCHRGWVLLTNCLGCFTASPSLEKPLLKYVSDYGLGGYKALCQHKALTAMQQTHTDPEAARNFPPTQLEWTANERKGKMVLDVYTYSEETFKAEVDSWTTGEQFATWILKSRGIEEGARGWSVSMFTGEDWRDLAGCDYVMDLIGETEDISEGFSSDIDYVITPQPNGGVHKQTFTDDYLPFSNGVQMNIPPAPDIQAPRLPPPLLNMDDDKDVADPNIYSTIICGDNRSNTRSHGGLDNYVDDLFDPVLSYGTGELERRSMLNQRMKGGGGIGPTHPGGFLSPGVSYMPNYSIVLQNQLSAPSNESGQDKKIPPPTAEKKARLPFMLLPPPPPPTLPPDPNQPAKSTHSPSIHKKQQPLLELFVPPAPSAPPPPPPPPFSSSPPPEGRAPQVSTARMVDEDNIKTQFYKLTVSVYFSYNNVPWKLFLRKEVFYPKEKFGHPFILNLLCEQIMRDTYSDSCVRISKEERRKMRDLLAELQVGTDVSSLHNDGLKKRIILAARDNWANYFSRLFPASGDYGSRIQFLGVSHRGIRLLKIAKAAVINPEHFKVLRSYSYADLLSVEVQDRSTLEFSLKNEQLVLYSPKARQIKDMIDVFLTELRKETKLLPVNITLVVIPTL
nr:PREDICTED: unconventional myosin-XVB-like [Latimeria chalumnae]|eukprot:XP_006001737.2 PREDICTED: unconventional myosin-XVB-like [Latimeria chalumnae]